MDYLRDYMKVKPTGIKLQEGKMLVSVPFYNDYYFNHTVVILSDYSAKATAGLIINRPTEVKVNEEIKGWSHYDRIFFGGPVGMDGIAILHNYASPFCEEITNGIYSGATEDVLQTINNQRVSLIKYRFYVGYAGWSKGQLESEISRQMWVIADCMPELIWDTPPDMGWASAVKSLGKNYTHWLDIPEDIHSN